jgi:hypothetical protein
MQTYSAWLQTLTPGQREELRQETDSARKLALVQKIKEEQLRDHRVDDLQDLPLWKPRPPRETLTVPELNSVMKVIVSDLPEEDQQQIGRVNKVDQHVDILKRSIQHASNPREWPSEALQGKMLNELPPHYRNPIKRSPRSPREAMMLLIVGSIHARTMEELRPILPTEAQLNEVLGELDEKQKNMLDKRPPEQRRIELTMRYFRQHPDKSVMRMLETGKSLFAMMEHIGVTPPKPPFGNEGPPHLRPGRGPGPGPGDFGPDGPPPPPGRFAPGDRPGEPPPRREGRPDPQRRDERNGNRKDPE